METLKENGTDKPCPMCSACSGLLSAIRAAEVRDGGGIIEVSLYSDGSGHIDRGRNLTIFNTVAEMLELLAI